MPTTDAAMPTTDAAMPSPSTTRHSQPLPLTSQRHSLLEFMDVEIREMFGSREAPVQIQMSEIDSINNFFRTPLRYERFVAFSLLLCFDVFLYNLSYLPFRVVRGLVLLGWDVISHVVSGLSRPIHSSNLYDVCVGLVMVCSSWVLFRAHVEENEVSYLDTNSLIALAALTSIMEALDALLAPFGASALDALNNAFWLAFGGDGLSSGTSTGRCGLVRMVQRLV